MSSVGSLLAEGWRIAGVGAASGGVAVVVPADLLGELQGGPNEVGEIGVDNCSRISWFWYVMVVNGQTD